MGDPAAWRVKDFADGWVLCRTEEEARRLADDGAGNLVQALYTSAPSSPTADQVEVRTALINAAETLEEIAEDPDTYQLWRKCLAAANRARRAASLIERLAGKEVERG